MRVIGRLLLSKLLVQSTPLKEWQCRQSIRCSRFGKAVTGNAVTDNSCYMVSLRKVAVFRWESLGSAPLLCCSPGVFVAIFLVRYARFASIYFTRGNLFRDKYPQK